MARHHKIAELLSPEDLEALKAFVRAKNLARTVDECHEWVLAKTYVISRTAVWSWLDAFRMGESVQRSREVSTAFLTAMREDGGDMAVNDAAVLQIGQLISDSLMQQQLEGEINIETLSDAALALQRLTLSKQRIEKTKADLSERFSTEAGKLRGKKEITQADIDEVRKKVFG